MRGVLEPTSDITPNGSKGKRRRVMGTSTTDVNHSNTQRARLERTGHAKTDMHALEFTYSSW